MEAESAPVYNTFNQDQVLPVRGNSGGNADLLTENDLSKDSSSRDTIWLSLLDILFSSPLNFLLLSVIPTRVCYYVGAPDVATFFFALVALAPLSERVAYLSEQVGLYFNESSGGAMRIFLGSSPSLIIAAIALSEKYLRLVQLYILGSILSYSMFALGMSFFISGFRFHSLKFNPFLSNTNAMMYLFLALAVVSPTVMIEEEESSQLSMIGFSRANSFVMLMVYGLFIAYQVTSHFTITN